jgi:hypothetical protein
MLPAALLEDRFEHPAEVVQQRSDILIFSGREF